MPPSNAPPCTRREVVASFRGKDGAGGHEIDYIRFRNVGRSTCLLAGYPRVIATRAGWPDVTATDGSFFPVPHTANMPSGGTTLLGVETDTYCAARPGGGGGGRIYRRLTITLHSGGSTSVSVPRSAELDVTCGLHLTRFWDPHYPQPEPYYPLSVLRARLELPRTARAGSTLRYIVDLRNPTGHRVRLTPCPGYVEAATQLRPNDQAVALAKRTFELNCLPIREVDAHRIVRFAMHLRLPADAAAGVTKVYWSLQSPDTIATGSLSVIK